ncbi:hypothetical protein NQ317_006998, partial [Molorchus minor]
MYTNPYSQLKRFPVTKRSSDYISKEENPKPKKVSAPKKQTDPKIEKDLRNIFGSKPDTVAPTTKSETTTLTPPPKTTNQRKVNQGKETKEVNKEVFSPVAAVSERPLQIKKKSIDWSDYFGLDRRKKSDTDDLDKEWLIERYHKSVAVGAKKRNAEAPLSSFRNHDEPIKKGYLEDADADKDKLDIRHGHQTEIWKRCETHSENINWRYPKIRGNFKSGGKDDDYTFSEEKESLYLGSKLLIKKTCPMLIIILNAPTGRRIVMSRIIRPPARYLKIILES